MVSLTFWPRYLRKRRHMRSQNVKLTISLFLATPYLARKFFLTSSPTAMKHLLLLSAGLLLASAAHAQFGLRAGANNASLWESGEREARSAQTDGRVGYQVGVFYEQKLSEWFSVVPEVQFSRQRIHFDVTDYTPAATIGEATYQVGLSYLHVPVLLRVHLKRFYVEVGPQSSFLLGAHEEGVTQDSPFLNARSTPFDRRAADRYQRYDLGLAAGFGVQLPAGFEVGLRTYSGLFSVTRGARSTYPGELNNVAVQANVAYQFSH